MKNNNVSNLYLFKIVSILIIVINLASCKEDDNRIYKNSYSSIRLPKLSWSVIGKKDSVVKIRVKLQDSGSRRVQKIELEYYEDSLFTLNRKTLLLSPLINNFLELEITEISPAKDYWARVVIKTDIDTFHFEPKKLNKIGASFKEKFGNNLILYCPFDGNAQDESGTGNNGTVRGALLTTDRFNYVNSAYSFDGVDDFIEVAHHPTLNCSSVTISVWFKANSFTASNGYGPHLISKREASGWGNSFQMNVGINQSQKACWADWSINGNGVIYYRNSTKFNTVDWFNLVYTHDGTNIKLYLNGSLVQSNISPGLLNYNTLPLWFGARPNAGGNSSWFNGKLDDIAIWNRVLSDKEVLDVYNYK